MLTSLEARVVGKMSLPNVKKKERKDVTMRKLCFLLTALLLTAPAFAGVTISCAQVSDTNEVEVSYVATDDANRPRAFGLDITLDNGMLIGDIVSGTESDDYWVYPGTIVIDSGVITDTGSPMAPFGATGALDGKDTGGMTIEMGSLYNDPCDPEHPDAPENDGDLFSFTVYGADDCNVTISGNGARGNVVLEDTEPAGDVTYGTCEVVLEVPPPACYDLLTTAEQALYDRYVTAGKDPTCWCWQYQCYGDASNAEETIFLTGTFRIYQQDLNYLSSSWKKTPETGAEPRADFNRAEETIFLTGTFSVYQQDLNILSSHWKDTTGDMPGDCPNYIAP